MKKYSVFGLILLIIISIVTLSSCTDAKPAEISSLDDMNGKIIGTVGGSPYVKRIAKQFPNSSLVSYDTYPDLTAALESGRIDGYVCDGPQADFQIKQNSSLKYFDEIMTQDDFAFVISKDNTDLLEKLNQALVELKNEGVYDELEAKWMKADGEQTLSDISKYDLSKGTLNIITSCDMQPFTYMKDNVPVGYDVDLANLAAARMGYRVNWSVGDFSSLISSVSTGIADIAVGGISVTAERAKTVSFSETCYVSGTVMMVLGSSSEQSFWKKAETGFRRTFITENRWQLILNGIIVTLELTLFSALFGSLLGFAFSFPLRSKNKAVRKLCNAVSTLLDGMPLVVLLMVLYYIIFSKAGFSAILVGIIGFTLDFANSVASLLNSGVQDFDKGQIEAAKALGYSRWQTYKKVTFPQVSRRIFPQYAGAVVGLMKNTSVIGYITGGDLTRAGDIIRNSTYDAFFPLITTAVIYFILAKIIIFIMAKVFDIIIKSRSLQRTSGVSKID